MLVRLRTIGGVVLVSSVHAHPMAIGGSWLGSRVLAPVAVSTGSSASVAAVVPWLGVVGRVSGLGVSVGGVGWLSRVGESAGRVG